MADGITRSKNGGKTAYLNVGIWYDEDQESIHLTVPGTKWFHTTVNSDDASIRCHKNLYKKLAKALIEAGVPAPSIEED